MKWPFGRRKRNALDVLNGAEWTCGTCNDPHRGMFDLACHQPDPWTGGPEYELNSALDLKRDFLSEDFCVLGGEHFLVRCVLEIPVHGLDEKFGFGCWGSLKKENFEVYVANFDGARVPDEAPWGSWLCNSLRPFSGEEPVACRMFPQLDRQRPVLRVLDADHPLARAQREGITPEEVLAIYAHHGHAAVN